MTRSLTAAAVVLSGALAFHPAPAQVEPIGFLIPSSVPEVVYFYRLPPGTGGEVTGRFIAIDVGDVAPAGYVISETTVTVPPGEEGAFSLSRPNNGWPLGRYRVDLLMEGQVVLTHPFVIQVVQ